METSSQDNKATILIAEDEASIRDGLVDTLESEGYSVVAAVNGDNAVEVFDEYSAKGFDLILLDIMMPGRNGYDVCRHIRNTNAHVPILMLTAKSEEIDKVVGLELGADDYITKPFGIRELLARIAAALRRAKLQGVSSASSSKKSSFQFGKASIDPLKYEVSLGETVSPLTERELNLIELFHNRPGEVLSREFLLDEAWGVEYMGTTRTLDQHIALLRKKVETNPGTPTTILTVHGIGYRYASS